MANKTQKAIIHLEKDFLDVFEDTLFRNHYVKIKGLGVFRLAKTKARVIERHPISGKRIEIPSHLRVSFRVSETVKRKLRGHEAVRATIAGPRKPMGELYGIPVFVTGGKKGKK
jgi:nucleoid DNA-binding protein